jgi:Peptidase family M23
MLPLIITLLFSFSDARARSPWPFTPLSIGNNMQTYQDYGTGAYWHDGLDIRCMPGQNIHSATSGKVVKVWNYSSGPNYWEVAILDDDGNTWKYHHVEKGSIDVKVGDIVFSGAFLGRAVMWPVSTEGEVYHHLHLLVVDKNGNYVNPFLLLEPLDDRVAPVIHQIGIERATGRLFVDTSDLTLHHRFKVPPHKISYVLDGLERKTVWEFVNLPSFSNDTDFINEFYLKGSCGNYSCRRFLINLNFKNKFTLSPGEHQIEVFVEDINGNSTSQRYSWTSR